jgi:two-component system cell cycle sensor histidine kinase PleC
MSAFLRIANDYSPPTDQGLRSSHAVRATPPEPHAIAERLSHEIRTPLNSVIGFSRVLKENRTGNQRPADLAMLEAIRTNGERLLALVEDLLALSIAQRPEVAPAMPLVNVVAVAQSAVEKWRAVAERKQLSICLRIESYDLVRVDTVKLATLLDKLIGNAIKFTPRGGLVVTVAKRHGWMAPGSVIVEDSGIGIPADQLATIFEPFAQVDGSTNRRFEGAGLGLPIAKSLAESMGCRLDVLSAPDEGARFEVAFPA